MAASQLRRNSILKTRQSIGIGNCDGSGKNVGFMDRKVTEGGSELPRVSRRVRFSHTNEIREYEKYISFTEGSFSETQDLDQTMCEVYNMSICADQENSPDWKRSSKVIGLDGDSEVLNQTTHEAFAMSMCEPEATEECDFQKIKTSNDKLTMRGSRIPTLAEPRGRMHFIKPIPSMIRHPLLKQTKRREPEKLFGVFGSLKTPKRNKIPEKNEYKITPTTSPETEKEMPKDIEVAESAVETRAGKKSNSTEHNKDSFDIRMGKEFDTTGVAPFLAHAFSKGTMEELPKDFELVEPELGRSGKEISPFDSDNNCFDKEFELTVLDISSVHTTPTKTDEQVPKNFTDTASTESKEELPKDFEVVEPRLESARETINFFDHTKDPFDSHGENEFEVREVAMSSTLTSSAKTENKIRKGYKVAKRGRKRVERKINSFGRTKEPRGSYSEEEFVVTVKIKVAKPELGRSRKQMNSFDRSKDLFQSNKEKEFKETGVAPSSAHTTCTGIDEVIPNALEAYKSGFARIGKTMNSFERDHTNDPFDSYGQKEFEARDISSTHIEKEVRKDFGVAEPGIVRTGKKINDFYRTKDPLDIYGELEFLHSLQHDLLALSEKAWMTVQMQFAELIGTEFCTAITTKRNRLRQESFFPK